IHALGGQQAEVVLVVILQMPSRPHNQPGLVLCLLHLVSPGLDRYVDGAPGAEHFLKRRKRDLGEVIARDPEDRAAFCRHAHDGEPVAFDLDCLPMGSTLGKSLSTMSYPTSVTYWE